MKKLTLICEAQVKLAQGVNEALSPSGKLEARVTTWGAREGADGRKFNYQPEGFADWATQFHEAGKPLPMFLNHNDFSMPMGEWNSFEFDDEGMTATGRLYLNTTGGSDLYQILKESPKMFGGVSVGAYADEAQMVDANGEPTDDDGDEAYFQITKGGLREVSVVMYPNNPNAEIQKLEFFRPDGSADLKVLEQALRDAGLNKKDAVTSVSILKKALEKRDATSEPIEKTDAKRDSDADVTQANELLKALEMRELSKALSKRLK